MIRFANDGDIARLQYIWKVCFRDTDEYIRFYYDNAYKSANTLVYTKDNSIVAMVTLLPMQLHRHQSKSKDKLGYIYAAATLPDYRRRGIMEALLGFAGEYAAAKGYTALVLCPATAALFAYYQKLGFCQELSHRYVTGIKLLTNADNSRVMACTAQEYEAARGFVLEQGNAFLLFDAPYERYALEEAVFTGCNLIHTADWYAITALHEDKLFVRELLIRNGTVDAALAAICKYHNFDDNGLLLRLPNCVMYPAGVSVPYALLKPLAVYKHMDLEQVYTNILLSEE